MRKRAPLALLLLLAAHPSGAAPLRSMLRVPAGPVTLGSATGEPDERPVRRVHLPAFWIDRTEVTQAAYARCVTAGACRAPRNFRGVVGPELPVVGVSWHDAVAYCRRNKKRLPTEAEWERAARGTDGRRFPWGEQLDCTRANFGNFSGSGPCAAENPGRVLPPGSRPQGVSPVGAQDMAGNVWEWTADRYPSRATGQSGDLRALRGGSCCSYFAMPTTTNRIGFPAGYRDRDIGFRCARDAR